MWFPLLIVVSILAVKLYGVVEGLGAKELLRQQNEIEAIKLCTDTWNMYRNRPDGETLDDLTTIQEIVSDCYASGRLYFPDKNGIMTKAE